MAQKIVIALPKGGVSKTTIARNLAEGIVRAFRRREKPVRVLLIELDPTGNLTQGCGLRPRRIKRTIYTEMRELVQTFQADIRKAVLPIANTIDLIPANIFLNYASEEFASAVEKEKLLLRLLGPVEQDYDVMIADTQPQLGFLVNIAFKWADEVLIPLQAEADAIESTALLLEHLKRLDKVGYNPRLAISGLLFTQVNQQTRLHQDAMEFARQAFGPYVNFFDLTIPRSVVYPEARAQRLSIFDYRPSSRFAQVFDELTEEVIHGTRRVLIRDQALEDGFLERVFEAVDQIDRPEASSVEGV